MADISKLKIKNSPSDTGTLVNLTDNRAMHNNDFPSNLEIDAMFITTARNVYDIEWYDGPQDNI